MSEYGPRHRRRSRQPYRKGFTFSNIMKERNSPGRYRFYGRRGRKLYAGSSKKIRSRLEDTKRRRGDARTVKSKAALIPKIHKYDVDYNGDVWKNREAEMREKNGLPFNKR